MKETRAERDEEFVQLGRRESNSECEREKEKTIQQTESEDDDQRSMREPERNECRQAMRMCSCA